MLFRYNGPARNNPKTELKLTYDDLLWIGRAYIGEHGAVMSDPDAFNVFVWCMVNRHILHPGNRHWKSFKFMLRRFSQPVNPRWYRDGDLARKHAGSKMCTEDRFRRRERLRNMEWDEFPAGLQRALDDVYRGTLPAPNVRTDEDGRRQRVSNFASATPKRRRDYPWGFNVDDNWYFEDKVLRRGTVVIDVWS